MRSIIAFATLFAFTLLCFTGCSDDDADVAELKGSLESIFENIDGVRLMEFDNLDLSNVVFAPQPTAVGVLHFRQIDDFNAREQEVFEAFIGSKYNQEYYIPDEGFYYPPGAQYYDPDLVLQLGTGDNGFLFWAYKNSWIYVDNANGGFDYTKTHKSIHVGSNQEDEVFFTPHGALSVKDAIDSSNQFIEEHWQQFETNLDFVASNVNIYEFGEDEFFLMVSYRKQYNGIPFSNVLIVYNDHLVENWSLMSGLYTSLFEPGEVSSFSNSQGIYGDIRMDELGEIVSLEAALGITSKELAAYRPLDVKYITLEYCFTDNAFEPGDHQGGFTAGTEYTANPVWVIYFDTEHNNEVYAIVNTQTGTFDFIDNRRG